MRKKEKRKRSREDIKTGALGLMKKGIEMACSSSNVLLIFGL